MPLTVRLAETADDLAAACRLRYDVLIAEHGRDLPEADHDTCELRDELDEHSLTVVAFDSNQIVGTQRLSLAKYGSLGKWVEFFEMERGGDLYPQAVSMSSRLAVAESHRRSTVPMRLATACYRLGIEHDTCLDFVCARLQRLPYLEKLGYQRCGEDRLLEGVGPVVPVWLQVHNRHRLQQIRSPFYKAAPPHCPLNCLTSTPAEIFA